MFSPMQENHKWRGRVCNRPGVFVENDLKLKHSCIIMFREFFLAKLFFTFWRKKMPLNITEFFFKKLCIHRHSCPIQCCKSLNFYSCMTCTWHKRGERNTTLKLAFFPHFFATFLPAHWQAHRAFHGNDIFFSYLYLLFYG